MKFTLRTHHNVLKCLFGSASASGKLACWLLRRLEFSFTVEYLSGKKNVAAPRFVSTTLEATIPINRLISKVPVLSIEDYINLPTLDDHKVAVPYMDEDYHYKSSKLISLEEMITAQKDYIYCQQCSTLIGLPSFLFDCGKYSFLVGCSSIDEAFHTVVLLALHERVISVSH